MEISWAKAIGRSVAPILVITLLLLCSTSIVSRRAQAWAQSGGPAAQVQDVVQNALLILRDKTLALAQKRAKLRKLVADHFDFNEMSRSVLGYHWRKLSTAQRQNFTELFTGFLEDSYLSRIQQYAGQNVKIVRQRMRDNGYAEVQSQILDGSAEPIDLGFELKHENGLWRVYDISVDQISIIENYRVQLNRIINNQGFDFLLAELRRKRQRLAADLGRD